MQLIIDWLLCFSLLSFSHSFLSLASLHQRLFSENLYSAGKYTRESIFQKPKIKEFRIPESDLPKFQFISENSQSFCKNTNRSNDCAFPYSLSLILSSHLLHCTSACLAKIFIPLGSTQENPYFRNPK